MSDRIAASRLERTQTRSCKRAGAVAAIVLLALAVSSCSIQSVFEGEEKIVAMGRHGRSPGRFNYPRAVLLTPDGNLCVIDKTGRIQQLSLDGKCVAAWEVPDAANGTPTGAVFATNGDLLVADTHYSRILRYTADGTTPTQFGRYGKGPGEMIFPTDVAVDREGFIYVTNYVNDLDGSGRTGVLKFRDDGTFVSQWGNTGEEPGEFRRPMALAVRGEEVIVADSCNHRIQVFDRNGKRVDVWGGVGKSKGQLNYPYDVTVGPKGYIYVCEYGNNRVSIFKKNGRCVKTIGGPGNRLGRFRGPWGCALDGEGALFVADTYNHRIQHFVNGVM